MIRFIGRTLRRLRLAYEAINQVGINRSLDLIVSEAERRVRARETLARLDTNGFLGLTLGDPTLYIGAALWLVRHFKIDLYKGTCYGDCRAVLEKENWRHELDRTVCSFDYGTFTHKLPEEVEAIYAFGKTVQEAVCQCLLNCKRAGVL